MRARWIPSPRQFLRLMAGLWLFGAGEALIVDARLGNSPWTVLADGVAHQTPLGIGVATIAISFLVLLLWIPLRQYPGLGTVSNAILVGVALDVVLALLPRMPDAWVPRALVLLAGIALVAIGSGAYLGANLGPGTRDGLMTGLHRRTGAPIAPIRITIEVVVLIAGALLGGRAGLGTIAFALLIGPAVALALRLMYRGVAANL